MKFHQRIMKLLSWKCEKQRQEFRHEMSRAHATAADLHRTVTLHPDEVKKILNEGGPE